MIGGANHTNTVSLIGMPGSGKSTVGVILAKLTGLKFVDTDLDIQVREQATLQSILERKGYQYLRAVEQEVLLAANVENAVIATGGSVVYSEAAMVRLKGAGVVVYLEVALSVLEQRVAAAPPRGIASASGETYAQIFAERIPLYEHYADITVSCDQQSAEEIAAQIVLHIQNTRS